MHGLPLHWASVLPGQGAVLIVAEKEPGKHKASVFDAVALGFNIVICGVYYDWTSMLKESYDLFLTAYFISAVGFFCVSMCIAEVSSFFSFGGGSFGYARCVISPAVGFFVGAAELMEYVVFVVAGVSTLGSFCSTIFGTSADAEPIYWFIFFALSLFTQVIGGETFWTMMKLLFVVSLVVVVFFFVSAVPQASLFKYAPIDRDQSAAEGIAAFISILPTASWIFFGMEALILTAEDLRQPSKSLPTATASCWGIAFVISTLGVFASSTTFPGTDVLSGTRTAFSLGLAHVYRCAPSAAMVLTIPATFASACGLHFAAGRLMASMASSRVLPNFLDTRYGPNRTPIAGLIVSSIAALSILFLLHNINGSQTHTLLALDVCLINACFVYVCLCACYWICSSRYSNMQRNFRSPVGVIGALVGALVFALTFIALVFFRADHWPIEVFAVFMVACAIYYYTIVRRYQSFSQGEVDIFMRAYVINANLRRKQEIKRNHRQKLGFNFRGKVWPHPGPPAPPVDVDVLPPREHAVEVAPASRMNSRRMNSIAHGSQLSVKGSKRLASGSVYFGP